MEISQGNSLCPLSQTSKNVMFFFLSFVFFLLQNQRTGSTLSPARRVEGLVTLGGGGGGEWW
jgi:hypothetical protein